MAQAPPPEEHHIHPDVAVITAYVLAIAVGAGVLWALGGNDPLWDVLWADIAATVVIFAFSLAFNNSSFYDAYWSVIPIPIVAYWIIESADTDASGLRQACVLGLVTWWGVRLTYNWRRGWTGLGHEDWRYRNIQQATGVLYWPASFLGIHLFPTLMVFGGLLGAYVAVAAGTRPFGWLDVVALVVTGGAIAIEAIADRQLRRFVREPHAPGEILATGLWSWSRHPNYFGEISFWWGLYLFGVAAAPGLWWTVAGPVAMTAMFLLASLPMIENRMAERRLNWDTHKKRVSLLIPRPPR